MNRLEIAFNSWGGNKNKRLIGAIINKIGAPVDDEGRARPDLSEVFDHQGVQRSDTAGMFQLPGKSHLGSSAAYLITWIWCPLEPQIWPSTCAPASSMPVR